MHKILAMLMVISISGCGVFLTESKHQAIVDNYKKALTRVETQLKECQKTNTASAASKEEIDRFVDFLELLVPELSKQIAEALGEKVTMYVFENAFMNNFTLAIVHMGVQSPSNSAEMYVLFEKDDSGIWALSHVVYHAPTPGAMPNDQEL